MKAPDVTEGRAHFIGASEAHHVLNLEPYGCQRQLALDKIGAVRPPSDPEKEKRKQQLFARGHAMEPVAVEKFEREFGMQLEASLRATPHHGPDVRSWLVAHPDRIVSTENSDTWRALVRGCDHVMGELDSAVRPDALVYEAKSVWREQWFRLLRAGAFGYHLAQVQHQMICTDAAASVVDYLWPDGYESRRYLIAADMDFRRDYLAAGDALWKTIEAARDVDGIQNEPALWDAHLPERLPVESEQCRSCPFRASCQGQALQDLLDAEAPDRLELGDDPDFTAAEEQWHAAREVKDEAEMLEKEAAATMKKKMGEAHVAVGRVTRFHWKPQAGRTAPDGKGMKIELESLADTWEEHPDLKGAAPELRRIAGLSKTTAGSRPFKGLNL